MKGAMLFRASGNDHPISPKNGTDFSLEELYEHIRCDMVQIVRHPRDPNVLIIMDEDGKLKHRPINQLVSSFFTQQVVVGDVVMCEKGFLK